MDSEDPDSLPKTDSQSKQDEEEVNDKPLPSNTIPFPSTQPETVKNVPEITNETQTQAYRRGQHKCPEPGAYKAMNDSLVATIAKEVDLQDTDNSSEYSQNDESDYLLLPDFAFVGNLCSEPKMLDEALQGSDAKEWQTALDYEIGQLEKLGTWVVEELPKGQSAIPCGEVLKIKRGLDGEVKGYRVRIVAGGHRQVKGVNYTEMFSSAAKMPTVHLILANTAEKDWAIKHVDVKSTYLNAPLKETVYMQPPRGVLKAGQEGKVLRLLKGLYGLKQAGQGWYLVLRLRKSKMAL